MTNFSVTHHYIGTIPGDSYGYKSRLRVTVSVTLISVPGDHQTTAHATVRDAQRFILTPWVLNASGTGVLMGGATAEPLKELIANGKPVRGVSMGTVRDLLALGRYHLNDMKPGCVHQEKNAGLDSPPCPETGYKWGHAWLVEPLPDWLTADYLRTLLGQ
jgi:hypothetical protein